jgi:hypothetical protein
VMGFVFTVLNIRITRQAVVCCVPELVCKSNMCVSKGSSVTLKPSFWDVVLFLSGNVSRMKIDILVGVSY